MSRDSSHTYIHMHSSRLADLFEEFCRPPSSTTNPSSSASNPSNPRDPTSLANSNTQQNGTSTDNSGMIQIPGSFLPYEEIHLPAHLMPINPEDEDDVVPDMHAAFGIQQALGGAGTQSGQGAGVRGEERWRDLGMEGLLNGTGEGGQGSGGGGAGRLGDLGSSAGNMNGSTGTRARREGRRTGLLLMR